MIRAECRRVQDVHVMTILQTRWRYKGYRVRDKYQHSRFRGVWHVKWTGALVFKSLLITIDLDRWHVSNKWVIIRWITISYVKTKRRGYKYRSSEET